MAFSKICTPVFLLLSAAKNSAFSLHPRNNNYCPHSSLGVSPLASDILEAPPVKKISSTTDLSQLCEFMGATPRNLLRVDTSANGVRGVYLSRAVKEEDVILRIPLESCVRDNSPPDWFEQANEAAWSTRLAAALLDVQSSPGNAGIVMWLKMMPEARFLRALLPIHWPDDVLSSARCTALELAVDSAYFARADALADLGQTHTEEQCEYALDLVQTRSCRVECNGAPIRLLAPIFDMINHGSSKSLGKAGNANAQFGLEENELVVRALVDVDANDQVLIDYGDSARPPWRCLASYGFVPESLDEGDEDGNIAEVYFHGRRFEVGPSTIPVDLVATASTFNVYDDKDEPVLTPDVALLIADRVSEVAFQVLLTEDHLEDDEEDEEENHTAEELISAKLAASLRWQQHRTLLACGNGLIDWAAKQAAQEKE